MAPDNFVPIYYVNKNTKARRLDKKSIYNKVFYKISKVNTSACALKLFFDVNYFSIFPKIN